jgi:hypothetical protein
LIGTYLLYLESINENEFIIFLHQVINSYEYRLKDQYLEKLSVRSKLSVIVMIIACNIGCIGTIIVYGMFITIAHFDTRVDFSIVLNIIWYLIFALSSYYIISMIFIITYFMYIFNRYMKYRFNQIQDDVKTYLETGICLLIAKIICPQKLFCKKQHIFSFKR